MRTRNLTISKATLSTILSLSTLAMALVVPDSENIIACTSSSSSTSSPSQVMTIPCLQALVAATYDHRPNVDMIGDGDIPIPIPADAASWGLLQIVPILEVTTIDGAASEQHWPAQDESIVSSTGHTTNAEYLTGLGELSPATHDDIDGLTTTADAPTTTSISSQHSGSGTGTGTGTGTANKLAQATAILSKLDSAWLGRKRALGVQSIVGQERGLSWAGAREMDDESDQPYWD